MNQNCNPYSAPRGGRRTSFSCGASASSGSSVSSRASISSEASPSSENPIPSGNRSQLLTFIHEVSFAVYDTLLYLDTHPEDEEAMEFFRKHSRLREQALREYGRLYGPLVLSSANECSSNCWEWMAQPWPWEGGDC